MKGAAGSSPRLKPGVSPAEVDEERTLLALLSHDPLHIDELIRESGLPTTTVASTLMVMELKGMIKQFGGMQYVLAR